MDKKYKNKKLFLPKLIYTLLTMSLYVVMRKINLFGVDIAKMSNGEINAELLLSQVVGGDLYKCTITAVGFAPYMIASIIVMIIQAVRSSDSKSKISSKSVNRFTVFLTLIIALIQSIIRSNDLVYIYSGSMEILAKFISVLEMVTGAVLVIWMSMRNKKYGIGAQMALITVNVFDGVMITVQKAGKEELILPMVLGFIMMIIMIFMENAEKRIPVQRISIHNIYADKNYQAIKFNPVGIFPVLFAAATFMLPQFVAKAILMNRPDDMQIKWIVDNMVMTRPLGIITYIIIIYLLNLLLSLIMINPKDLADNFLKSGDSIENKRPGKETKRYLSRNVKWRAFWSSTIINFCLGGSLLLQSVGILSSNTAMLPSSIMMLSGLGCALYFEAEAIINTDSYKAFI